MLKEGTTAPNGSGCSSNGSRVCDTCRSAACVVYCRADSAYLCSGCDARIHAANWVASRQERVWVCEVCERAPAAFLCKADAASLCSSCDADIHSANPLASRHHRVPVLPVSGCTLINGKEDHGCEVEQEEEGGGDEAEAASWLLLNDLVGNDDANESNGFLFFGEVGSVDEYLEIVDCNNSRGANDKFGTVRYGDDGDHEQQHSKYGCIPQKNCAVVDGVVPVQNQMQKQFQPGFEFESLKAAFSYNGSVSQSVSISSMEVGIVPESTISDVSISHSKPPNGMVDLFSESPAQLQSYLTPVDREARVLRYREKKKTRKFVKKIRYASRKAYAETRPRIKGRFAKRTDVEAEVDQMLSSTLMTEAGYSVVPYF